MSEQQVSERNMAMLDWALTYVGAGYRVFPIHTIRNGTRSCGGIQGCMPGNHPVASLVPNGLNDATTDIQSITMWWSKMPDANIGLATGKQSNLVVLIVGGSEGEARLASLERKFGSLPQTVIVKMGNVRHLHLAYPRDTTEIKSIARPKLKLEVRGDGGYVLAPPSTDETGQACEFVPCDLAALSECLPWLVAFANHKLPGDTDDSVPNQGAGSTDQDPEPTQRQKLLLIGLEADLWHDKDGNPFATAVINGHDESFATKSSAFHDWLIREYGERNPVRLGGKICPLAPSSQPLKEALNALSAKAAKGSEHQTAVRVAGHDGLIYLDLGTPDWSVVEVSASEWRIISNPPIRFVRPAGFRPLPAPVRGGGIGELRSFLNVASDVDFVLIVSWLIAALRPIGPYPVLIINGEQGSGKSICCRVLRRLIDPNAAELRSDTRKEEDVFLAAKNGWVLALDNLSYLRNDFADTICRITTKGAFATRKLYFNDEEFFLEVCRPVLLNGIPPLASRADLADRAIALSFLTMEETKRRPEEEFWLEFENAAPRILGALLDGLSGALRSYRSIKIQRSSRMIDFVRWAEAGWQALGAQPGIFGCAYIANRSNAIEEAIDADLVAGAIVDLVNKQGQFVGTATKLLSDLEIYAPQTHRERNWPRDATRLSSHLRRLPPLLRQHGIEITYHRTTDAARKRIIEIRRIGPK
jgi:putative DNA primase/helicase